MSDKYYYWKNGSLVLRIYLKARAKKNGIVSIFDNYLKIHIKAAPVKGKADDYLIRFLAKYFAVSLSNITIRKGYQSQYKRLLIRTSKQLPNFIHSRKEIAHENCAC